MSFLRLVPYHLLTVSLISYLSVGGGGGAAAAAAAALGPVYLATSRLAADSMASGRVIPDLAPYSLRPYDFARHLLSSQSAVSKILGKRC